MRRLGLLLFTAIFLGGGRELATDPGPRAERARKLGLPVSDQFASMTGWAMMTAALGIQLRPLRRLAALLLALELSVITFVGHRFWDVSPEAGPQRFQQRTHFLKNLSLVGAALYIFASAE
jgi:uncharacterized membrane protein YphA (DoxX/SURF4 family)